ncbi:MAG: FAD-binding protein [Rhodopirellula sp.]|nr:FAD-binding protein [Rhodopirellula sp.]
MPQPHSDEFEQALRANLRGEVFFDLMTRGLHATDASHYQILPQCVVVPVDEADVIEAVTIAGRFQVPITPRGGATSLSGQTFGSGMVIDVSKYMDQVLEVNPRQRWARVQPGAIRDQINARFKPHGLQFAPDPATGNRATIGGMIGNNSSGMRSIIYGKTIDHVLAMKVVTADGTVMQLEPCGDDQWQVSSQGNSREAEIYRGVKNLVLRHQDEIRQRYPKVMRRVSGYNLDEFVDGAGYTGPIGGRNNAGHRTWNLSNLIVGSEGTLAFVLEAKIKLEPLPKATAMCIVHFCDLFDSLRAVVDINAHHPSAVELLDDVVLREAVVNASTRHLAAFIEGEPDAVLMVEVFGEEPADAAAKIQRIADDLRSKGIGYAWPVRTDSRGQAEVWEVRKVGLGLISNAKGPTKGQAFVEDACVPVEVLPEYVGRLKALCEEFGCRSSVYAHASVGVLHFRPMLDLHKEEDREKMVRIADQAFEMVQGYGGSFAGEHGDGLVRGQFVPRCFGPQLYEAFRELKALFDPGNLMNPGKIVDTPSLTSHLRYGEQYLVGPVANLFQYREQGGFAAAVEQCNGVGACRKLGSGTMCPSYMATRDEEATTRGRANALRLGMSGQLGPEALRSDRMREVLELCLSCKACKSECPNAVDMAKLKADVQQMHHDEHGVPLGYRMVGAMPDAARRLAGPLGPIVNFFQKLPGYRWLLEKLTGIDRRRPMPPFPARSLRSLLREREAQIGVQHTPTCIGRVVLFDDTYANYMEPRVGLAAVDLLESIGYEVILARAGCCQRPRLSKGLVRAAKRHGTRTMENLDVYARQGLPILCLEPSCASALADDLPDLIDDEALGRRVAACVKMIDVFLAEEVAAGKIPALESPVAEILLHGHCHQKALFGTVAIRKLFAAMPATNCQEVDSGCCGMAGSFGYEHHDLSEKIGEDRLFPAVREAVAEGKTIVACGISCRHQLRDFLGVEARHWVEVVRAGRR